MHAPNVQAIEQRLAIGVLAGTGVWNPSVSMIDWHESYWIMHLQVFEDSSGAIVMCFDSHKAEAEG